MLDFIMHRKTYLPKSPEEFDSLVDLICRKYRLTDKHHAAAIISVAIRHLPNDQATTTLKYLGHSVLKNISNYVAYNKAEILKHESQVNQLVDMIKADPNNQQAWDELNKAASEGSDKAKAALALLQPEPTVTNQDDNVVSIKASPQEA